MATKTSTSTKYAYSCEYVYQDRSYLVRVVELARQTNDNRFKGVVGSAFRGSWLGMGRKVPASVKAHARKLSRTGCLAKSKKRKRTR